MRAWLPLALLLTAQRAYAQDTLYHATHREAVGRQVVAIYIGAVDCQPCVWPDFKAALRRMWPLLAHQAQQAKTLFATLGVAISEDVDSGLAMLQPLTQCDELSIGGSWVNHVAAQYIWADSTGIPAIPQVLVITREVNTTSTKSQWSVSPYRVVFREVGAAPLRHWIADGAPVAIDPPAGQSH